MSLPRVFTSNNLNISDEFELSSDDSAHLKTVLRLKPGDQFEVVDRTGRLFLAGLLSINSNPLRAQVVSELISPGEPGVRVVLVQGLPKGDKMDLIIQKATELGVAEVVPLVCDHSVVRYPKDKAAQKVLRWQKIAQEAATQADRLAIPQIWPVQHLSELLDCSEFWQGLHLLAAENSNIALKQVLRQAEPRPQRVVIYIGPEGSFSASERRLLEHRARPVSLGPRILRTETAGMSLISMIMYEFDQIMP